MIAMYGGAPPSIWPEPVPESPAQPFLPPIVSPRVTGLEAALAAEPRRVRACARREGERLMLKVYVDGVLIAEVESEHGTDVAVSVEAR